MDWNDLRLFVLAARLGGLAAAARAAGVSPPTLGRRLQALEAATGRSLFERRPSGYVLTDAGRDLLAHAEPVEAAMLDVERWRDHGAAGRPVRVSAGSFTSRFLAQHLGEIAGPGDDHRLQLLTAEVRLDIGRRAADIGIRNLRPEEAWLAGQRIGEVAYAIYGAAGGRSRASSPRPRRRRIPRGGCGRDTRTRSPSRRPARGSCSTSRSQAPDGRCCPASSATPSRGSTGSRRLPELTTGQWLVMHHEERHDPAVREVARRIARLLRAHRASSSVSQGRQPSPGVIRDGTRSRVSGSCTGRRRCARPAPPAAASGSASRN